MDIKKRKLEIVKECAESSNGKFYRNPDDCAYGTFMVEKVDNKTVLYGRDKNKGNLIKVCEFISANEINKILVCLTMLFGSIVMILLLQLPLPAPTLAVIVSMVGVCSCMIMIHRYKKIYKD